MPAWSEKLSANKRPPLPLPEGVVFGRKPGWYFSPKSRTVLERET